MPRCFSNSCPLSWMLCLLGRFQLLERLQLRGFLMVDIIHLTSYTRHLSPMVLGQRKLLLVDSFVRGLYANRSHFDGEKWKRSQTWKGVRRNANTNPWFAQRRLLWWVIETSPKFDTFLVPFLQWAIFATSDSLAPFAFAILWSFQRHPKHSPLKQCRTQKWLLSILVYATISGRHHHTMAYASTLFGHLPLLGFKQQTMSHWQLSNCVHL